MTRIRTFVEDIYDRIEIEKLHLCEDFYSVLKLIIKIIEFNETYRG